MGKNLHVKHAVTKSGKERWQVWKTGNKRPYRSFEDRREAIAFCRDKAEEGGLKMTVHTEDGYVHTQTDYR